MSSGSYNIENEVIDKQIYITFKYVIEDTFRDNYPGTTPLHILIEKDKPIIKDKVKPKEFFYYLKDEVDQYDKTGQFVDRKKALEIWNLMEGYYPPKQYNTASYFNDLKKKDLEKKGLDTGENKQAQQNQKKYREAFY